MKRSVYAFALLLLFGPAARQAWARVGLNVDPPKREFTIAPGGSLTDAITVQNKGDKKGFFLVTSMDLYRSRSGEVLFSPGGTHPRGLGAWIRVNPTEFELEPDESRIVRFTVTPPKEAAGSYLGVIFFQTRPEKLERTGALVSAQVGSVVVLHVSGKVLKKGDLIGMGIAPYHPGKPLELALTFKNEGNWLLRPKGKVSIKDASGRTVGEAEVNQEEDAVLPGDEREFKIRWTGQLAAGSHTIEAMLDYGGQEFVVGQTRLTVGKQ